MINKNEQTFLKKKLPLYIKMASSVSLVGAMGVAGHAYAADSTEPEEIVVTGQRASIESALATKKGAEVVMDSISAVDIGALPDRSVSEALQRVPGVTLQRTNENRDPGRMASEGGAVFVRGLSWVRTELNGRDIFSASNGRSLGFEDVSSDLMKGIDVVKSPSADLIEGGLGGTVNLRTRLPFDQNKMILAGGIDYNYADLYEKGFNSGNALYSDSWDTDAGKFGVLLSASLADIGNRTDTISAGRYEDRKEGSQPVLSPTGLGAKRIDWQQSRNAYNGALQWSPNDDLTFTLQGMRAEANPIDVERALSVSSAFGNGIDPGTGTYTYNSDGVLTGGTVKNAAVGFDTRYGNRESATTDVSFNFKWNIDDHWKLSGDLQRVESSAKVLSFTVFTNLISYEKNPDGSFKLGSDGKKIINPHSGVDASFDLVGSPSLNITDPSRFADQSQYYWAAAMDHIEDNDANSVAARLDAEYTFDNDSLLNSFRFGARSTDRDSITRQSGYNWGMLSHQFWGGGEPAFANTYSPHQTELYTFDNFFRGDIAVPTTGWIPTEHLVSDTANAYDYLKTTETAGWGWSPLTTPSAYEGNAKSDNILGGVNDQNEKTSALYAMVRFDDDSGNLLGIPVDGNFGVRVVRTESASRGRMDTSTSSDCAPSTSDDCAASIAFRDDFNAKLSGYQDFESSYTNTLPSLNIRFLLQDDLMLRFGLSRSMVRPNFSQTRPYKHLDFKFQGTTFDPAYVKNGLVGTGSATSADLKPTTADQFDASVEWYFANQASLTFAAFYKSIANYVMLENTVQTYTYGGNTYNFDVASQVNASEGTLQGFEVAYQQFFDFLPGALSGLGVQTNYTYVDNKGGANTAANVFDTNQQDGVKKILPIEGMSRNSFNFAVLYEKYDVSARLAYNWRERYLMTTSAANINRPVWSENFGQLDGSVFYTINEHLKTGLQVTNILNSQTKLLVGSDVDSANALSWTDTDRRIAFVVRAQF